MLRQVRLLIKSLWDVSLFSQDYCSIDSGFGASFPFLLPSLLPALRESPPGGEPQAAVNTEGD